MGDLKDAGSATTVHHAHRSSHSSPPASDGSSLPVVVGHNVSHQLPPGSVAAAPSGDVSHQLPPGSVAAPSSGDVSHQLPPGSVAAAPSGDVSHQLPPGSVAAAPSGDVNHQLPSVGLNQQTHDAAPLYASDLGLPSPDEFSGQPEWSGARGSPGYEPGTIRPSIDISRIVQAEQIVAQLWDGLRTAMTKAILSKDFEKNYHQMKNSEQPVGATGAGGRGNINPWLDMTGQIVENTPNASTNVWLSVAGGLKSSPAPREAARWARAGVEVQHGTPLQPPPEHVASLRPPEPLPRKGLHYEPGDAPPHPTRTNVDH